MEKHHRKNKRRHTQRGIDRRQQEASELPVQPVRLQGELIKSR